MAGAGGREEKGRDLEGVKLAVGCRVVHRREPAVVLPRSQALEAIFLKTFQVVPSSLGSAPQAPCPKLSTLDLELVSWTPTSV